MENFNRIKAYLLNQMSSKQRQRFEVEVKTDNKLAEELEIQRFQLQVAKELEKDALRAKLTSLETKKPRAIPAKTKITSINKEQYFLSKKVLIPLAASLLFLIGLFFYSQNSFTIQDATLLSYEDGKIDFLQDTRNGGTTTNFDVKKLEILQTRNKQKVKEAIDYFSAYTTTEINTQIQAELNLGHAYLLSENFEKAVTIFTHLEDNFELRDRIKEEVQFFKAISLLNKEVRLNGKINPINSEGISILKTIKLEGNRFDILAEKLLDKLQ